VQAPDPNITIVGITATAKHTSVDKSYEIANHLGNVLATLSDRRVAVDEASYHSFTGGYVSSGPDGEADAFAPDVLSYSDYYPFGMQMPGRNGGEDYRYAFNGMEQDPEVSGDGNSYTTEFRGYDPRLGKWKSLDPLMSSFPHTSPYVGFANNPIYFVDPTGKSPDDYFDRNGSYIGSDNAQTNYIRVLKSHANTLPPNLKNSDGQISREVGLANSVTISYYHQQHNGANPNFYTPLSLDFTIGVFKHYYGLEGYDLETTVWGETEHLASLAYGAQYDLPEGVFEFSVSPPDMGRGIKSSEDVRNIIAHERGGHGGDFVEHVAANPNFRYSYNAAGSKELWETTGLVSMFDQFEYRAVWFQIQHESWDGSTLAWKENLWQVYGKYYVAGEDAQHYFGDYGVNTTRDKTSKGATERAGFSALQKAKEGLGDN
jgi:RHS repeat-associated protein